LNNTTQQTAVVRPNKQPMNYGAQLAARYLNHTYLCWQAISTRKGHTDLVPGVRPMTVHW